MANQSRPARSPRLVRWLRVTGLLGLVLVLAAVLAYRHYTRPERLRAIAEQWLARFTGGEVRIERAAFNPLHGLLLSDVSLAIPAEAAFDPSDDSFSARTLFRCGRVYLRLDPGSLLRGRVVVPEVVIADPEFIYVQRTRDGVSNWQTLLRQGRAPELPPQTVSLPVIRLGPAQLVQYQLTENGRVQHDSQRLEAEARPLPDRPEVYDVRITRQVSDAATQSVRRETGRLQIDTRTLAVIGRQLPAIKIDDLVLAAPPGAQRWIDLLGLEGSVQAETLELGGGSRKIELTVADARFSVPIAEQEKQLGFSARHLRFEEVGGTIGIEGTQATFELEASFHGAPLRLTGSATMDTRAGAGLDALGFELAVEGSDVPLPRDDPERDSAESRFVRRWKPLRNFVHDFDGVGVANFSARLQKAPGEEIRFMGGVFEPRNVSARYVGFPYRIFSMTGTVAFRPDGTETIDLKGLHNGSVITFSGWEGGFRTQAGDLTIHGYDVPLDDDLRRCMAPADQALCERFGLQARMDLVARLTRSDAPPGTPDNPWKPVIDVTFRGGRVRFDDFPYPLEDLRGHMRIAGGIFEFQELTARRGPAKVSASGTVQWSDRTEPVIELQLEAIAVPLDATLAAALPPRAGEAMRRSNASGRFDLSGTIHRQHAAPVAYELIARLRESAWSLPTAARVTDMSAQVRISSDRITVESAQGMLGGSVLNGEGWLSTIPDTPPFSATITCERLALDDETRRALPADYRRFWDDFQPSGAARVELRCERRAREEGAGPGELDYALQVEPLGASATYEGFPLPLEDLHGTFTATPHGVEIRTMQARSGSAAISFFGRVEPAGHRKRARLAVQARQLQFDESLRMALPRRIRRQWDALEPRGEIDVDFDQLELVAAGDTFNWRLSGQVALRGVSLSLGSELADAHGSIRGTCEIGDTIAVDSDLTLQRIRIDERLLTDAQARIRRSADDPIVHVELARGRFYEGNVSARAQVDYGPMRPTFAVELDTRGVALDRFLNARRRPGEPPVQARGIVDARLALAGRFGDPFSRSGNGQVTIREAQIAKIPWMLSILQVLNLTLDDNAFDDALFQFLIDGQRLLLYEIDLRGKALSMVGGGVVNTVAETLDLTLLAGGPMKLPRIAVLSDLLETVAREVMEVHVGGTLENPTFRAEVARSLRRTVEALLTLQQPRDLGG